MRRRKLRREEEQSKALWSWRKAGWSGGEKVGSDEAESSVLRIGGRGAGVVLDDVSLSACGSLADRRYGSEILSSSPTLFRGND